METVQKFYEKERMTGTLKACINVDHMDKKSWGPPLVDADWYAFCQAICKGN